MKVLGSLGLVGSLPILKKLFKPFGEWVYLTRRREGLKKPVRCIDLVGARVPCSGDGHCKAALGEIILRLEPACAEFIAKQRSPEASWLNIKQLTEPHARHAELISTRPI